MSIKKIFENSNQDNDPNAGIDWQWKGHDKQEKNRKYLPIYQILGYLFNMKKVIQKHCLRKPKL